MASMVKYIVEMLGMFVKKVANNNSLIPQTDKQKKSQRIYCCLVLDSTHIKFTIEKCGKVYKVAKANV